MEFINFLIKQRELLEDLITCLEKEKQALIKEDAQSLLDLIEEKKQLLNLLEKVEEKRKEIYPGLNLRKMEETGVLDEECKKAGEEVRDLMGKVQQLQETNQLLTQQSLEYTNQMLFLLRGNQKPTPSSYGANGKIGNNKNNAMLDRSV